MAVTIAPAVEAMTAIRDRINSGTAYVLAVNAEYSELQVDERETLDELRVDVTSEDEEQLNETLDTEGRTSHNLKVLVRCPVERTTNDELDPLKLLVQQLFQRLNTREDGIKNGWQSADGRVKVWQLNQDSKQNPDKTLLNELSLFVSNITLRVEVEAS